MTAADQDIASEGEQDLSMEEILQSIRKIIAEEGDAVPAEPQVNGETGEVPGSDVLELTQMLDEPTAAPPAAAFDILQQIDASLAPPPPPPPAPAAEVEPEDMLLSQPVAAVSAEQMKKVALARPTPPPIPSAQFRTGNTVEELVIETLKPMLKEWLDKNLPTVVERIVEKEVKKLASD